MPPHFSWWEASAGRDVSLLWNPPPERRHDGGDGEAAGGEQEKEFVAPALAEQKPRERRTHDRAHLPRECEDGVVATTEGRWGEVVDDRRQRRCNQALADGDDNQSSDKRDGCCCAAAGPATPNTAVSNPVSATPCRNMLEPP